MVLKLHKAVVSDLENIRQFTDYWLAGRGMRVKTPGAVNDYFISPSQHKKYITKYDTFTLQTNGQIVAWAVVEKNGTMIHFLVAGDHRGKGIGKMFLKMLHPKTVHSKSNQSTGNPGPFYIKQGYKYMGSVKSKSRWDIDKIRPDRKPIIDIFQRIY